MYLYWRTVIGEKSLTFSWDIKSFVANYLLLVKQGSGVKAIARP